MKVLIDTNIWIDIAARPISFPESALAFKELERRSATICFPLCAYTTVYYLLSKVISDEAAQDFLRTLHFRRTKFMPFGTRELSRAWEVALRDHEDSCIAASADLISADLILTRDESDFSKSPIKALSPAALLKQIG